MHNDKDELFDQTTFYKAFEQDMQAARALALIQSAYITPRRVEYVSPWLKDAVKRGVRVCVFIQEPYDWHQRLTAPTSRLQSIEMAISNLERIGVHVNLRTKIHEKMIVIDDKIFWDGCLNILSHYDTSERMTRWTSRTRGLAAVIKHKLHTCEQCTSNATVPMLVKDTATRLGSFLAKVRLVLSISQIDVGLHTGINQARISAIAYSHAIWPGFRI